MKHSRNQLHAADFHPSRRHFLQLLPVALTVLGVLLAAPPVNAQEGPAHGGPPGGIGRCLDPNGKHSGDDLACLTFSGAGAMADFNGDGFTDLAISTTDRSLQPDHVQVIFGSAAGLSAAGNRLVEDVEIAGDFGYALAAADFNRDGFADLVVGDPGFDDFSIRDCGAVHMFFGPDLTDPRTVSFNSNGGLAFGRCRDGIRNGDRLGEALTVGDFNGDRIPDLAIGAPFWDIDPIGDVFPFGQVGAVVVLYSSPGGFGITDLWRQNSPGVQGAAQSGDRFGAALAAGDFNGDGIDDLAIGVPNEQIAIGSAFNGGVNVLYGSTSGLTADGNQFWSQSSNGIPGLPQRGDRFGSALAAGDFNGDGADDLSVGVPGEDFSTGVVHILYGRRGAGLTANGTQLWSQDTDGIKGTAEKFERFGAALAAADFDGDGRADLAIGIPNEAVSGFAGAGAVQVLRGSSGGLTSFDQLWNLNVSGVRGIATTDDHFGATLAWGDFNGDGRADLAIGIPGRENGFVTDAGAVQALYGSSSLLTAEGNQHWQQGRDGLLGTPFEGAQFGRALY